MHPKTIELKVESKLDHVQLLSKAVRAICNTIIEDEIVLYNLELCLVEAAMNVIEHAHHLNPDQDLEIIVILNEKAISFHVFDNGAEWHLPPLQKSLDLHLKTGETMPDSGIGLFLIRHMMDEVYLGKKEAKNMLVMKKKLNT